MPHLNSWGVTIMQRKPFRSFAAAAFTIGILAMGAAPWSEALAMGSSSSSDNAESRYTAAVKAVNAKSYDKAVGLLQKVLKDDPKNADALNYLAYSQRNLGKLDDAMANYNAALAVNPNHLGALEYQGELYLMMKNRAGAEANLAKLNALCTESCPEQRAMQRAMNEFNKSQTSSVPFRMGY
jgi:tetratricopeptide (TPR) repeat protein